MLRLFSFAFNKFVIRLFTIISFLRQRAVAAEYVPPQEMHACWRHERRMSRRRHGDDMMILLNAEYY